MNLITNLKTNHSLTYDFWKTTVIMFFVFLFIFRYISPDSSMLEAIGMSLLIGAFFGAVYMPCIKVAKTILPFGSTVFGFIILMVLTWIIYMVLFGLLLSIFGETVGSIILGLLGLAAIAYHIWQTVLAIKEAKQENN